MGTTRRTFVLALGVAGLAVVTALAAPPVRRLFHALVVRVRGSYTVQQRVEQFTAAQGRLRSRFDRAGVSFPPARVVLLGLKDERRMEVYAGANEDALKRIEEY